MSSKTADATRKNLIAAAHEIEVRRPGKAKLSPRELLKRMNDFDKRKDEFVASIRKSKD